MHKILSIWNRKGRSNEVYVLIFLLVVACMETTRFAVCGNFAINVHRIDTEQNVL